MVKKVRGTRDILFDEIEKRRKIENILAKLFESYGYRRVETPTFEYFELFSLKSGEEIKGSMYIFEDKKGRKLALRPELTAPIARMYSEELIHLSLIHI